MHVRSEQALSENTFKFSDDRYAYRDAAAQEWVRTEYSADLRQLSLSPNAEVAALAAELLSLLPKPLTLAYRPNTTDNKKHTSREVGRFGNGQISRRDRVMSDVSGFLLCEPKASTCVMLPMANSLKRKRPLLILDLDETLIHGVESRLHRDADFMVGPFHVYKRPHLDEFLRAASAHFEMAVWSSASWDYVVNIADELSSLIPEWQFVWSRFRCTQRMHPELMQNYFVKDLKKVKRLGYDLDRVLIVDDTRLKVSRNYGNAIYIPPFEGADDDRELPQLGRYINWLRLESNFRTIEKRGWRTKSPSN